MAATPPHYDELTVYGPFHRRVSTTQRARDMREIVQTGELWGDVPHMGAFLAVEAIRGPLPEGRTGFEFYAVAKPDRAYGPPRWRRRDDGTVWESDGLAKMRILISRVTMDIE